MSGLEEDLEKTEEKLLVANQKFDKAATAADDSERMKKVKETNNFPLFKIFLTVLDKVLQNKAEEDEKKMMQLEADLKAARTAAEDADASYEEISKKLLQCEADLERAEERAETGASIIFIFFLRDWCCVDSFQFFSRRLVLQFF